MNPASVIIFSPHLLSKILYEYKGLSTPSCLAFLKAEKEGEIMLCPKLGFVITQTTTTTIQREMSELNKFICEEFGGHYREFFCSDKVIKIYINE